MDKEEIYTLLVKRAEIYTGKRKTDEKMKDFAKDLLLTDSPKGLKEYEAASLDIQKDPSVKEAYLNLKQIIDGKKEKMINILSIAE